MCGVSDGIRTRGHLDHNQVLYQLSYTHHARAGARRKECNGWPRTPGNRRQASRCSAPPCSAASVLAVSESGPGGSTNTVER